MENISEINGGFTPDPDLFTKSPSEEESSYLLYNVLISSFGAIIVLSNLAVVISSCHMLIKGQNPRTIYLLLGNIALADLLTGIGLIFGQIFPTDLRNHQICAWEIGFILSNVLISLYCNCIIAIDRYLYILYGSYYQKWIRPIRVLVVVVLLWILGCVIGYLPLMGYSGDTEDGKTCWFISVFPKRLIVGTVIISMLPLLLWIFLYSIIGYIALNNLTDKVKTTMGGKLSNLGTGTPKPEQCPSGCFPTLIQKKFSPNVNSTKRWKAIKLSFFTTCSFAATWFPYMITSLYYLNICDDNSTKKCKSLSLVLSSPMAVLGFVNSLLNPIIYAWWHKGFNKFMRRVSTFRLRNLTQERRAELSRNSNVAVNPIVQTNKQKGLHLNANQIK